MTKSAVVTAGPPGPINRPSPIGVNGRRIRGILTAPSGASARICRIASIGPSSPSAPLSRNGGSNLLGHSSRSVARRRRTGRVPSHGAKRRRRAASRG